jgi:hypothetical protein
MSFISRDKPPRCLARTHVLIADVLFFLRVAHSQADESLLRFEDVSEPAGINFQHRSPLTTERHLHLFMGSGTGWVDYDRDGWPDLYLGQGKSLEDEDSKSQPRNRFLSNSGGGILRDVTESARLTNTDYSMGVAVGDFDNDGFPDVYVSSYDQNRLYHNNGDTSFSEIAADRHVDEDRFGSSSTWADIDGDLDLFVAKE